MGDREDNKVDASPYIASPQYETRTQQNHKIADL